MAGLAGGRAGEPAGESAREQQYPGGRALMDWISDPLDRLQWALWHFIATIFWAVDRLVLIGAVLIHTLRKWITNPGGIIDLVMSSMLQGEGAVSLKTF